MHPSLEYAREVYAACATIGFTGGEAATLKVLLDRLATGQDVDEAELMRATQAAQVASIARAGAGRRG